MRITDSHRCPAKRWEVVDAVPANHLCSGVLRYRGFRFDLDKPRRRLEIPTGAVTVLFNFGPALAVACANGARFVVAPHTSVVFGIASRSAIGEHCGRFDGLEVVLAPWMAFTLFGTAMCELADAMVDLSELRGRQADEVLHLLAETPDWSERFTVLDAALAEWAAAGPPPSRSLVRAWHQLVRAPGLTPITSLADEVGWSQRQLESRFQEQVGVTPKTASRVLRLQRALRLLVSDGASAARVAATVGYNDQSHFSRECKSMTNCSPRHFLACRALADRDPSIVDRLHDEVTSAVPPD
jgi:AraC-like DNA-binding protein